MGRINLKCHSPYKRIEQNEAKKSISFKNIPNATSFRMLVCVSVCVLLLFICTIIKQNACETEKKIEQKTKVPERCIYVHNPYGNFDFIVMTT